MTTQEMIVLSTYEDALIDIFNHWQDFTTSDFQGCISAIVQKIYKAGKENQ